MPKYKQTNFILLSPVLSVLKLSEQHLSIY